MARLAIKDFGTCLKFNGSGGVTAGNPSVFQLTGQALTISVWVNIRPGNPGFARIVAKETSGNVADYALLVQSDGLIPYFQVKVGGVDSNSSNSGKQLTLNTWHLLTGTFDGSTLSIYVDGILASSNAAAGNITSTANSNINFGKSGSGGTVGKLLMDEVRIWNVCLTAAQVYQLYSNVIPLRDSLIGEWLFDEGSGTTALDSSGQGNNATITTVTYLSTSVSTTRQSIASRSARDTINSASGRNFGRYIDVRPDITQGIITGHVLQVSSSILVIGNNGNIKKSTDLGQTWTSIMTLPSGHDVRGWFIDSQSNLFLMTEDNNATTFGRIYRSTNSGDSWTQTGTAESSAWWRMTEDSSHNLYANEYSKGSQDANELYAYNIWKSTDHGATWSKFHSEPAQSSPGAKDGIRHIHHVFCDSSDQLYTGFGDLPLFAGNAGNTYLLNSNGTLGTQISSEGNGHASINEADDTTILLGGDATPYFIAKYFPITKNYVKIFRYTAEIATIYSDETFDILRGKDDVYYALVRGSSTVSPRLPALFVSTNQGYTWRVLLFTNDQSITCSNMTLNRSLTGSRLYLNVSNASLVAYYSIPDYTKAQINAMVGTDNPYLS